MSSTYTDKNNSFHGVQRDIPNLEFSPSHVSIGFSHIAFPTAVLPNDDRTDSAQEEQLGLPYWTMILAICVVVDESKCLDTPILEFSIFCEHLPILLGYISRYCVCCLSIATRQSGDDMTKVPLAELRRLFVTKSKSLEYMERKDGKKTVKCGER